MRRKYSLKRVASELRNIRRAIVCMRDMEAMNRRLPGSCAAMVAASHIPHIDACLAYLDHLEKTPKHGLAAQPAAVPPATSPGQVSPAVPGASTPDRS